MSNYKKEFISEAREQLETLSSGLLTLEKEPENKESINQVFRACHTLKGNAAMMGYTLFSELSHSMEDILSSIREKKIKITKENIDILLESLDALEESLYKIEKDDVDNNDTHELQERLKTLITTSPQEKTKPHPEINNEQKETILKEENEGKEVYRIVSHFSMSSHFKEAKIRIILKKAKAIIEKIIYSKPNINDLNEDYLKDGFEIIISTKSTKEEIKKIFNSVSDIDNQILKIDEPYQIKEKSPSNKIKKTFNQPIQSIKVDVKKLDNLVNIVGELLISNMRLKQISKELNQPMLSEVTNTLDLLTSGIQKEVMMQRMIPVGQIFSRFPRYVRDVSSKLRKKINFEMEGEDIELDRTVLDEIGEPLIHLIRNSIDHGIETEEERIKKNKDIIGNIKLTAKREKNSAIIIVKDDGAGISSKNVKEKAISMKLITNEESQHLTKEKIYSLIFQPGFSTKKEVTELSGRGVGLDVVQTKIRKLGGNIKLESEIDKGTKIKIKLPLSLAIISSLLVKLAQEKYVIPLSSVLETVDITSNQIQTIQGNEIIILRNEEIPIIRLSNFLNQKIEAKKTEPAIIFEESNRKIALIVDQIINQQPILVKNLHKLLHGIKGFGGATILGDGKVSLILDMQSLTV